MSKFIHYEGRSFFLPNGDIRWSSQANAAYLSKRIIPLFTGQDMVIRVSVHKKSRTDKQNRYYWGVIIPTIIHYLCDIDGAKHDPLIIHQYHLQRVLRIEVNTISVLGQPVIDMRKAESSKLSIDEFNVFIEKIMQHWSEKGLVIPESKGDDYLTDHF